MSDTATREDLLKQKAELVEADEKRRHELKGLIQIHTINVDEVKTHLALTQNTQKSMKEDIKDIKVNMKEGFGKIEDLFKGLPETFATKQEHKINSERIHSLEKGVWWFIGIVATGIIVAILKLIII